MKVKRDEAEEAAAQMTFEELAELEPGLAELLREAEAVRELLPAGARFCANAYWYGYKGHRGMKKRLVELVGWLAPEDGPPELRTMSAYDTAYETIYEALPDCHGCDWICM
jgi:hypothetical protein